MQSNKRPTIQQRHSSSFKKNQNQTKKILVVANLHTPTSYDSVYQENEVISDPAEALGCSYLDATTLSEPLANPSKKLALLVIKLATGHHFAPRTCQFLFSKMARPANHEHRSANIYLTLKSRCLPLPPKGRAAI